MKAFIITMSDKPTSVELAKKCRESVLHYAPAAVEPIHFEAVQPKSILSASTSVFGEHLAYTYPESPFNSHMDFNTNLYLKAYDTNDVKKIIACSLSHMKLWKFCVVVQAKIARFRSVTCETRARRPFHQQPRPLAAAIISSSAGK